MFSHRLLKITQDPLFALVFGIGASSMLFLTMIALHNEEVERGEQKRLEQVQKIFARERQERA